MHVLIITQIFLPEMGALANRMYPIVRELVKKGHKVTVATGMPNYPDGVVYAGYEDRRTMREEMDGFAVERTLYYMAPRNQSKRQQLRSYLSFLPAVYRSGRRAGKVDVVFVTSPPIFPVLPAMRLAKRNRAKLVFDIRDMWPDEIIAVGAAKEGSKAVALIRKLERAVYKAADLVCCTTHAFEDAVVERGVPRERTLFAPNGADLALFKPFPRDNPVAAALGLEGKFVVAYSGLLGIKHGLDQIIDAAEILKGHEDVAFLFVGNGPRRAGLEEAVRKKGLTNVRFLGARPIEELPQILAAVDVCVTTLLPDPYFEKILAVKIFEYMACGKPIVAALRGEGDRAISEAGAGIVVPPGDAEGLAKALLRLRDDPGLRDGMGKRGKEFVEANFSREAVAARIEEALGALVAK